MKGVSLVIWLTVVSSCSSGSQPLDSGSDHTRTAKFFPLYEVVRFRNDPCVGANFLSGTCYTQRECRRYGGVPSGSCAKAYGVCCIILKTCGSSSKINNTYFTNPFYPLQYTGTGSRCDVIIRKCDKTICQLRLDFLDFSLLQPNGDGSCENDVFTVTGSGATLPRICGENSNQHVYVDFLPGDTPIQLRVDTSVAPLTGRKWNVKVAQIACNSASRAPVGCLMYHTQRAGNVMSFNYGATVNPAVDFTSGNRGTREMASENYGVCVRSESGYCSIEWSQSAVDAFTVSGDSAGVDQGTSVAAVAGANCLQDFVVIPNPSRDGVPLEADRFCGNALPSTTTSSKPFVLTVITDASEHLTTPPSDIENRGFSLNYRQILCGF